VIPKNVKLREAWSHHPAYQRLKTISKDQFLIEQHHEGFVFKDLRFGQAGGWSNPKADFVFRYQVQAQVDEPNYNVIALPRPFDDPKQALVDLWFRIWGLTPS
jgi:hypothetical protein